MPFSEAQAQIAAELRRGAAARVADIRKWTSWTAGAAIEAVDRMRDVALDGGGDAVCDKGLAAGIIRMRPSGAISACAA